jgi:DNA-binding winged helix-turn-helix (wHTH) protein/Tol biopolymer transport system component
MASATPPSSVIRFGAFELDVAREGLRKSGVELKLYPQPFRVLLLLASRPGQIVKREEIQHALWGDNTFVDFEAGTNFCIKQIRDTLGDDAERPKYIETIPRRGYRFIAAVSHTNHEERVISFPVLPDPGDAADPARKPDGQSNPSCEIQEVPAPLPLRILRKHRLPRAAIIVLLVALGFAWWRWRPGPSERRTAPVQRQITWNPPEDWVAASAISPDGRYVAYADVTGLAVRSLHSGETRSIPLPANFPPAQIYEVRWFPEGGKLLLTRRASLSEKSLWVVEILGQTATQKLRDTAFAPAISPDGQSLVFLSGPYKGPHDVWVSGIRGEGAHKLALADESQKFASPVWSPDGQWIAYSRMKGKSSSIEIRLAKGGPAKTLVSESSLPNSNRPDCIMAQGCLCWLPDWRLVFSVAKESQGISRRDNSLWQIRINPSKGEPSQRAQQIEEMADLIPWNLTTTVDGTTLAFTKIQMNQNVYIGELSRDGTLKAPHRFTLDNHNSIPDGWTLDNRSLLFVSNRNGRYELYKQGLNDSVPERLATNALGDIGSGNGPSPDGAWILYWEVRSAAPGARPSSSRLMRQPTAGGPSEAVFELHSEASDTDVACPVNPSYDCVLNEWEGSSLVFYSFDAKRGKGHRLAKLGVDKQWAVDWAVSPDGSQVAVIDHSHNDRIEVLNLSDRTWREISVEPGWEIFQSIAWAAQGRGFFISGQSPESFNMIHVALSGKVQVLLSNPIRQWMHRPRASSDGKYLAFQAETADSNVWVLENL